MFSKSWKSSKKPTKQRNYIANAPKHILVKLMNAHLSKELSDKHGKRSIRIAKGDKVLIVKGQYAEKTGKIESVDIKKRKVFIAGVDQQKKDGSKIRYPISVSNVMITELNLDDKKRQEALKRK